jgi:hypothetical protein
MQACDSLGKTAKQKSRNSLKPIRHNTPFLVKFWVALLLAEHPAAMGPMFLLCSVLGVPEAGLNGCCIQWLLPVIF